MALCVGEYLTMDPFSNTSTTTTKHNNNDNRGKSGTRLTLSYPLPPLPTTGTTTEATEAKKAEEARLLGEVFDRKAELFVDSLERSGGAKPGHPEGCVRPPLPPLNTRRLNGHNWASLWEHRQLVGLVLVLEQLPARHGHHAGSRADGRQGFRHVYADVHLRACQQQQQPRKKKRKKKRRETRKKNTC